MDTGQFRPDPELRAPVRARLKLPDDMPVILYAGRICAQKQPRVFAAVMRELKRRHKRFRCLVLGDGEDLPWLRRYISRQRLEGHVWLLGAVSNEAMREYLAAGDIFFLPSQMEGISLAIYEAMAMGLAVVGADVGGQRELVTPECGILIQRPDDVTSEAQRYVETLSALLDDPERRRALGAAARARVEQHFRLQDMGEAMVKALLERAPVLHAARPKSALGGRLSLEHVQITLEEQRLAAALGPLTKYAALESLQWRAQTSVNALWQRFQHSALWWRVLKPSKDRFGCRASHQRDVAPGQGRASARRASHQRDVPPGQGRALDYRASHQSPAGIGAGVMDTSLAVIIPTYNAGPKFAQLLETLRSQTLSVHELVVIDSGSTDGTPDLARRVGARAHPAQMALQSWADA